MLRSPRILHQSQSRDESGQVDVLERILEQVEVVDSRQKTHLLMKKWDDFFIYIVNHKSR